MNDNILKSLLPKKQKKTLVQVRVNEDLKLKAKGLLKDKHGMSLQKFIHICLEQLIKEGVSNE